ncbi:MAG TPA: hypothetical protein DD624_03380 [Alphaproteobacteria bacterium]|nr:hypothetical protein [Alphaproteobacteria bacterium]
MFKRLILCALMLFSTACVLLPSDTLDAERTDVDRGRAAFERANYAQALEFLVPEAEKGDMDAQYTVGLIYRFGLIGEINSYLAQKYLLMAANQGHYAAQEQLAFLYSEPYQPLYNPIDAYHWYKVISARSSAYQAKLDDLHWYLKSRGLLEKAEKLPIPKEQRYHGINYNSLFFYR